MQKVRGQPSESVPKRNSRLKFDYYINQLLHTQIFCSFFLLDSALEKSQLEIEKLKENLIKVKENGESF